MPTTIVSRERLVSALTHSSDGNSNPKDLAQIHAISKQKHTPYQDHDRLDMPNDIVSQARCFSNNQKGWKVDQQSKNRTDGNREYRAKREMVIQ